MKSGELLLLAVDMSADVSGVEIILPSAARMEDEEDEVAEGYCSVGSLVILQQVERAISCLCFYVDPRCCPHP